MRALILGWLLACAAGVATAGAAPLNIVAAENFYGDVARQIGGAQVSVTSILSNPDQDPHEFEASPSTARALAGARLVIYNGADYDPWTVKLLSASPSQAREIIVVATLIHKKAGDNPHLWYEPGTMPALAAALADTLSKLDPAHRGEFTQRLAAFRQSLMPLSNRIAELREKYAGIRVTATEPVFGYMAAALGLDMRNPGFQLAVMNDTEPSVADVANFEQDLRSRTVKALIYNSQTSDALTRRMRAIATASGVPVVGVSETEPGGKDYQEWMISQLDALGRALAH
jgi:zinc/manganese transport system substrate-binding protein